ncbi:dolichyl-phosphate-mannose--protein mannosyltransferase [Isoptericola jiangsuensis]|uniref:dolichyl-phosphate-mannose--protein mannosyltransferase n=1 Tax=Isoptericola jiangsuensis TaxID=548579 RepID=UPI003AAE68B4
MSARDVDSPAPGDQSPADGGTTASDPATGPVPGSGTGRRYPSRRDVHGHRPETRGVPVVTGALRALEQLTVGRSTSTPTSGGTSSGGTSPGAAVDGTPSDGTVVATVTAPSTSTTSTTATTATTATTDDDPFATPASPAASPASPDSPASSAASPAAPGQPAVDERTLLVRLLGERRLALGATWQARAYGWIGVALITLLAAVTRLWNLGKPGTLVFDETYYVKDAFTLGSEGYERKWPDDPNPAFEAGDVHTYLDQASYVVHPPVGKWMIWLGMEAGGGATNPFAWRLASAVVGILAVFLLARIARRLFASTTMGLAAGFLLAIDGQAIVHSRTALLDQFLMFWVLVAFGCLLLDREQARRRLAARIAGVLEAGGNLAATGPRLGFRWWRLAAGVSLGLACGVKWSGLYFIVVFGLLTVLWDLTARRRAGVRRWVTGTLLHDALPAFVVIVPVAALTYLASWFSWIASKDGYYRTWAADNPGEAVGWMPDWLASLWHYHQEMYKFHTGLSSEHAYAASPLGWIVQWRPTSFHWERYAAGEGTCPADTTGGCAVAVTALGNPLLWYLAAIAIVVTIALGVWLRDWRALAVLSGTVAGWLPWFQYTERTIFTFYSITFTPWVILTLLYPMVVALERTGRRRGRAGVVAVIAVVMLAITAVSVAFYPFWSAMEVPYDYWRQIFRFQNWI